MASRKERNAERKRQREEEVLALEAKVESRRKFLIRAGLVAGVAALGGGYWARQPLPPEEQKQADLERVIEMPEFSFIKYAETRPAGLTTEQGFSIGTPIPISPLSLSYQQKAMEEGAKRGWTQGGVLKFEQQVVGVPLPRDIAEDYVKYAQGLTDHFFGLIGKPSNIQWEGLQEGNRHGDERDFGKAYVVDLQVLVPQMHATNQSDPNDAFVIQIPERMEHLKESKAFPSQITGDYLYVCTADRTGLISPLSEGTAKLYVPQIVKHYGGNHPDLEIVSETITESQAYGGTKSFLQTHFPTDDARSLVNVVDNIEQLVAQRHSRYRLVSSAIDWIKKFPSIEEGVKANHQLFSKGVETYMSTVAGANWHDLARE